MIYQVEVSRRAERSLTKAPKQVAAKFLYWQQQVQEHGLDQVMKIPGYHDGPMSGKLKGVLSVDSFGTGIPCLLPHCQFDREMRSS